MNTSSTRVEAEWNVATTTALTGEERTRVMAKLTNRIGADGTLRVAASDTRSQKQNRELAAARLTALVSRALVVPRPRKATRTPRAAHEARLREKRIRSERKRGRGKGAQDE